MKQASLVAGAAPAACRKSFIDPLRLPVAESVKGTDEGEKRGNQRKELFVFISTRRPFVIVYNHNYVICY